MSETKREHRVVLCVSEAIYTFKSDHITHDDDWATAPPQLVLEGVANVKNHSLTHAS